MRKITLLLCSFLFVSSIAFSNNDTFFFENDIFTVVKKVIDNNAVAATSGALDFSGNAYVTIPNIAAIDNLTSATFEAWVYWRGGYNLFMKGGYGYGVGLDGNVHWWQQFNQGAGPKSVGNSISTGAWTHIAVTIVHGGALKFYKNGVLTSETTGNIVNNGGPLYIGTQGSCLCNYMSMQLDEFRIWNVVKTEAEIQASMNVSLSGPQPNLMAYYDFEDGSGTTLTDKSGNGNHGTLVNMDGNSDWVAGKYGNSSVTVDNTPPVITLNTPGTQTIEVGTAYTELTATANDNVDGNISANISITGVQATNVVGQFTVSYDVSDAAGNAATTATRLVDVVDTTIPIITLVGDATVTIEIGSTYSDAGATANDNYDGNITGNIINASSVNTSIVASYTLTYNVTDANSNAATQVTRTVNVVDITKPTAIAQDITVQLNASGEVSISADDINNGSSDDSDGALTYELDKTTFDCEDLIEVASTHGTALDFDDVNDNIVLGNKPQYDFTVNDAFTIEAWINPSTVSSGWHSFLAKDHWSAGKGFVIYIANGGIYFEQAGGGASSSGGISASTWTHIAATYNNGIYTLYLNGAPQGSSSGSYVNSSSPFVIGNRNHNGGSSAPAGYNNYPGKIDDVRIWNIARSASEIMSNMNQPLVGSETGLVGYYPFEDGQGDVITDLAMGNNASIAVSNMDASSDWVTGKALQASTNSNEVILTVTDPSGNESTATANVTVEDSIDPTIALNGDASVTVLFGDTFNDEGATAADNCSATVALTGTVDHTKVGSYTLSYMAVDGSKNESAAVTRTVNVVDTTIPVITLTGNNPQIIDVNTPYVELSATATDNYDGDITGNIVIDYSAVDVTAVGSYVVTYDVSDVSGNPAVQKTRTVFVLEHGKPWAKDDSYEVAKNSSNNTFKIIENDSYGIDGLNADHSISLSGTYTGTGGKLDLEDSTVKYTPRTGYVGIDGFSYIITDENGDAFTGYVTINVLELTTPVANADYVDIIQNSSNNSIDVLANDSFGTDGLASVGSLTVSGTSAEAGSLSIDSDKVMYTPAVGFFGDDSFSYTIKDATGETASAIVTVRVTEKPLVSVPIAEKDAFSVGQNSSNNVMNVLADNGFGVDNFGSDGPIDGGLTFTSGLLEGESDLAGVISIDTKSTLSPLDDEIRYTPRVNFYGIDSFKYMITDATGDTSIVEVTIEVIEKDTPTAVADVISVLQDSGIISIDVLLNDSFGSDGSAVAPSITLTSVSSAGSTIVVNSEKIDYTPLGAFSGTDTFSYTITDATGDVSAAAVVTVTVSAAGTANVPLAQDDAVTVTQNSVDYLISILANDSFGSDGRNASHPISLSAFYTDNGGKLELDGDAVKYTPRTGFVGEDRFTYILTDSNGDASRAEVTVTVLEIDTPTAVADAVSVLQDSGITSVDVLANDSFGSDGAAITSLSVSGTSVEGGVIAVNAGMIDYTPFAGFSGVDSFDYTITDGSGDTATGTVTILVESVYINDAPTAENDAVSVIQNSVDNMINILEDNGSGKDTFGSDGPNATHPISLSGSYTDLGGKLDLVGTSVKYSPRAGFIGVDTFDYIITDSNGDADRAMVTVTVTSASPKAETTNDGQDVIAKNEFLVYPNPSNGYVKTTVYSTINTTATISLFDVTGKVIYSSVKQITTGKNEVDFNVNVKAGVLFLRVVSREVNFGTSKIVFK